MNELSICQALITQIERIVRYRHAPCVGPIELLIGLMSGINKKVSQQTFLFSKAETVVNLAHMVTREIAVRVKCGLCKEVSFAAPTRLVCQKSGNRRVNLASADELIPTSMALNYDRPNVNKHAYRVN